MADEQTEMAGLTDTEKAKAEKAKQVRADEEKAAAEAKDKRAAVLKDLAKDAGVPKRHSIDPAVSDFGGDPQEISGILSQLTAQGLVIPVPNDKAAEDGVTMAHQITYTGLQLMRELGMIEEEKPKDKPEEKHG